MKNLHPQFLSIVTFVFALLMFALALTLQITSSASILSPNIETTNRYLDSNLAHETKEFSRLLALPLFASLTLG